MEVIGRVLTEVLAERRQAVIKEWLAQTLQTYPPSTTQFLTREKDPFHNPVGCMLREGLSALFDGLVGDWNTAALTAVLDGIVRIRAVQDFTASQAVAFVFLLKQVVREELKSDIGLYPSDLRVLEARIDELALLAFDLFMQCRQRINEIRANEARRRVSLLERAFQTGSSEPTR